MESIANKKSLHLGKLLWRDPPRSRQFFRCSHKNVSYRNIWNKLRGEADRRYARLCDVPEGRFRHRGTG